MPIRWSIMAEGQRIVRVDLPDGAVITRMDLIAMGPAVVEALRVWCARHQIRLQPHADGLVATSAARDTTITGTILRLIQSRPAA